MTRYSQQLSNSLTILGVYSSHDMGACLLRDGKVITMIEEERLNRFKHARASGGNFYQLPEQINPELWIPWQSINYCLKASGYGLDDLDAIVIDNQEMISRIPIKDQNKIIIADYPRYGEHHFLHALSTFFTSHFEEAAVLVVDGDGNTKKGYYEAESGYYFSNRNGDWYGVFKNRYPWNSGKEGILIGLGWMYDNISAILGFSSPYANLGEPGKTMALAAYGRESAEFRSPWIKLQGFSLDFSGFQKWIHDQGYCSFCRMDGKKNSIIKNEENISPFAKNMAFKVQQELEKSMIHLVKEMKKKTGSKNLCLAGGVALNSITNAKIASRDIFDEVFILPACHDGGQSLGLAYYGYLRLMKKRKNMGVSANLSINTQIPNFNIVPLRHAMLGRNYSADKICKLLKRARIPFYKFSQQDDVTSEAALELSHSKIIGWFQGGSEIGPRALGSRSILADPRDESMKDFLNTRIKFRERFRPFAPSVLKERASEVFEMKGKSPYMLLVVPVRGDWLGKIPAVTHCDGTVRVQTVDSKIQPFFYQLIKKFEQITNVPLVLNTSFNFSGQPIVETPRDALKCFLFTEIDCCYLENLKIEQPDEAEMYLSWTQGCNFSIEKDKVTKEKKIYIHTSQGTFSISESSEQILLFFKSLTNKGLHLKAAFESVYADKMEEDKELWIWYLRMIKELLRIRVLTLRLGKVLF